MNKYLLIFLLAKLLLIWGCANKNIKKTGLLGAQDKKLIASRLNNLISLRDPHLNLGVKITSLDTGEVIYERNSQRKFIPASTIKLFTLGAALYYLGPSYRYETKIYTNKLSGEQNILNNLYIKGSGDPSLQDHDLIKLAYEIKQMGIKKITGDIFIDDSIFDDIYWGTGTMWRDRIWGYSAPVSGLNLNYNRILVKNKPAYKLNTPIYNILSPPTKFIKIKNQARTKNNNRTRKLSVSVEQKIIGQEKWPENNHEGLNHHDIIYVHGQTPLNAVPHYAVLAVRNPSLLAGVFFSEQLKLLGIKFTGNIKRQKLPENPILLATHQSRSLSEALIDFTKISNNFAMDALIKTIAYNNNPDKPASAHAGMKLVKSFLQDQVKINTQELFTADGSGLSRYNLVTPDQLNKLLFFAANNFNFGPEFIAALPIAGQDGNLGWRFTNEYLRQKIRAKGGTLSGISNLSGYFLGENKQRYSFAIMINNFVGSARKYQQLQEEILSTMMVPIEFQLAEKNKVN